ncbi:SdrD B-like domain-containing protein [Embleya sp. AB8]|uniref:SdrD B-like domain-containing protein n=1 Tax=Embleya sp. AB8 TaxID=3156304 RepID=UPI003C746C9D
MSGIAALAVGIGGYSLTAAPAAYSQPDDGSVTVRVVRAVDTTGVWSPVLEPGIGGVTVTLTGDDGGKVTGVTVADGTVTLAPDKAKPSGSGKYRVQVVNPKPGVLFPAFASRQGLDGAPNQLSSNEEFVDLAGGKHVAYTTGLWSPGDYCQKNAPLATACQPATREPASQRTLVTFPYNARGADTPTTQQATGLATNAETGTLYGMAWSKPGKRLFSSAMAKRDTTYGPGGAGAIYVTDVAGKSTSLFTSVPDAGASAHGVGTSDDAFLAAAGRESLGDLKISDDGRDLFVVNLNNRKLYRYDATLPTATESVASYAIPDPGCPAPGDWRPFGLGLQDGNGYVGGVCSGESTGKVSDLRAVVLPFDPATGAFGKAVLNQPLDYPRKFTLNVPCPGAGWFPWTNTFPTEQNGRACVQAMANPEPELADIAFETDGSMLLAFRDRLADRVTAIPRIGAPGPFTQALSGGDLNKACLSAGTYVMDTNTGCGMTPRGTRFFNVSTLGGAHPNSAYAGLALSKVEDFIATSGVDPNDTANSAGTMFTKRDGTRERGSGLRLTSPGAMSSFGKGASMGDLEVLCDQAPLQIGNRVWYDPERKGIQSPSQRPVEGATVNLYDESGKVVGTTRTTKRGEYYFDDSNVTGDLKPKTKYTIRIDNPADYATGGPLHQWVPTDEGIGDNRFVDSKGIVPKGGRYPERALTTGGPGENDHTFDFGFRQQEGAVRLVKNDQDGKPLAGAKFELWKETNGTDGLQPDGTTPDTKIGDPCTTGTDGICTRNVEPGTYYWKETSPPDGYAPPDKPVLGPLVLNSDNLDTGVSVTAVNKLVPTTPPTTPSTPSTPDTPTPPATPGGNHGGSPGILARTGLNGTLPSALAASVAMIALGGGALVLFRRRQTRQR